MQTAVPHLLHTWTLERHPCPLITQQMATAAEAQVWATRPKLPNRRHPCGVQVCDRGWHGGWRWDHAWDHELNGTQGSQSPPSPHVVEENKGRKSTTKSKSSDNT